MRPRDVGVPAVVHVLSSGTAVTVDGGSQETQYVTKTPNKYFHSEIRAGQRIEEWIAVNLDSVKVILDTPPLPAFFLADSRFRNNISQQLCMKLGT